MAVLDRFLKVMFEKNARAVFLESDKQVQLEIDGSRHPVTKDPVSSTKILTLIKEIMPEALHGQLGGAQGRVAFGYMCEDQRVDVETERAGDLINAVLAPAKTAPSAAVPGEDGNGAAGAVAAVPSTGRAASLDRAEERIRSLLNHLVQVGGSDLHLRVAMAPTYRTDGELAPTAGDLPLNMDEIDQMLSAIMPDRNKREYAEISDTDFAYEVESVARFRCNAFRDRKGPAAVFRVIPTRISTADELGLTPEVQKLCYLTKGLVLVTGPTGSGKSTTLAGMVDLINRTRTDHILTIEDPIEFVHENKQCLVTQRQVGMHTQSFKRALRAALREDPDIVLIGELRDLETIAIGIETAETGHLVFGTLHTTTATSTVDRMIDQFPSDQQSQIRVMLSESLRGVIAQVLLRKKGGGRVAAREILVTNDAVSNLIREGKTFQLPSIIQTNRKLGMITMNDSLIQLVDQRLVEPEEAYAKATDKGSFEIMLKQRGLSVSRQ
jgi:twitching motility protein PilT